MKYFMIVLLALVATAVCQAHARRYPSDVHIVDNNPSDVHIVDHNPDANPGEVVDPGWQLPSISNGGYEQINADPEFVNPNQYNRPKLTDNEYARGG